jgi:hypothetical protein
MFIAINAIVTFLSKPARASASDQSGTPDQDPAVEEERAQAPDLVTDRGRVEGARQGRRKSYPVGIGEGARWLPSPASAVTTPRRVSVYSPHPAWGLPVEAALSAQSPPLALA